MTLQDEVAQLVFIAFNGELSTMRSREHRNFLKLIRQVRVGGLILNNIGNGRLIQRAQPYRLATLLNSLQRIARTPLMVGGDLERGASMRVDGTTVFPHAMAFGAAADPALARDEGEVTAREARALGIHWVFFPVADVNNNPDNPIINIRSFGEDPHTVAALVKAFIEGAHADKKNFVLTTAKHFPGHGDTAVDSHTNLPVIPADRARLDALELIPFKAAIESGADSIMTAHVAVPALAPPDLPATLSPAILTDLLRNDLGFKGLVVTDALDMAGVARGFDTGEAAVRAIEAGVDALLMPADPEAAIRAVVAAVKSGRLSRKRIQESVIKILSAKEKLGLDKKRFVAVESLGSLIDSPESRAKAQRAADRAMTLVRNTGSVVPLAAPERACYLVMPPRRTSSEGQRFSEEVRRRAPDAQVATLDPTMPVPQVNEILAGTAHCDVYVAAAFARVGAFRGMTGEQPYAIETITASGKPVVLVALGSPYLLRSFPNVSAYLAAFSTVAPSESAAVRALWGEISIGGRMPVSIPGVSSLGEGIAVKATRTSAPAGDSR